MNLLQAVLWHIFIRDTPEEHPNITKQELEYICQKRADQGRKINNLNEIPFREIMTSLPVIAIAVAHSSGLWVLYTFILLFPKYLNNIQGKRFTVNRPLR